MPPGPRESELSLPALRAALLPKQYDDNELKVADYVNNDSDEAERDAVRCARIVEECTADELAKLLAAGLVGSREDFHEQFDGYDRCNDISLLEHVMPDVGKMRVVLEHDPTIDMHTSSVCRAVVPAAWQVGDDKLCAYLHLGGHDVQGILLLLAHFERNPVYDATLLRAHAHLWYQNLNAVLLLERLEQRQSRIVAGRELVGSARRKAVAPPWPWPPVPRAVRRAAMLRFTDHCTPECWHYPREVEAELDAGFKGSRLGSVTSLLADVLPGIACDATPFDVLQAVVDAGRAQDLVDCLIVEEDYYLIDRLERDHGVLVPRPRLTAAAPLSDHGFAVSKPQRRPHPFDHDSRFEQWRLCCFGKTLRDALGMTPEVRLTDAEFTDALTATVGVNTVSLDALIDQALLDGRSGLDLRAAFEAFREQFDADPGDRDELRALHDMQHLADDERSLPTLTNETAAFLFERWYDLDAKSLGVFRTEQPAAALVRCHPHARRLLAREWNERRPGFVKRVLRTLQAFHTDWTDVGAAVALFDKDNHPWTKVRNRYGRSAVLLLRASVPMLKAHRAWVLGECVRQWQEMADIYNPKKTLGKRLRREYDSEWG